MSEHRFHDVGDTVTCDDCGGEWCALCTPTPSARCPFEYDHDDTEDDTPKVSDGDRLAHALRKMRSWVENLESNATVPGIPATRAQAMRSRADDLRDVIAILDGTMDDYIAQLLDR